MTNIRDRLKISPDKLDAINKILLNPDMEVINDFLEVVGKYGTPEEINAKADSRTLGIGSGNGFQKAQGGGRPGAAGSPRSRYRDGKSTKKRTHHHDEEQ